MDIFDILVCLILLAVILLVLYQNQIYKLALWKVFLIYLVGAFGSYVGINLLAYFEAGYRSGWSFFGCVFLVPIAYLLLSKIIKVPYPMLMDFAGPSCATLFMLIKVNCAAKGCCGGFPIIMKTGKELFFPVQIIEVISGFILLAVLLRMQKEEKKRGKTAPVFLLVFGMMRFAYSFLREEIKYIKWLLPFDVYVPVTHLWPIVCIIWGLIWMYRIVSKNKGQKASFKEVATAILDMFRFRSREEIS